jgi:hypothetical protein
MKTLSVLSLSVLLLSNSPAPPTPTQPAALEGSRGPGIQSCALGADGVLSAGITTSGAQDVRYIFFGDHGQWIGEQWTYDRQGPIRENHLLASQDSIERDDINTMSCTLLTQLNPCGRPGGWIVDEGPDIQLASLLFTREAISVEFEALYNDFFSRCGCQLRDQLYYVRLDDRELIEAIVTGTKAQLITLRFAEVKPGLHKLFYGFVQHDYSKSAQATQRMGSSACFRMPAA